MTTRYNDLQPLLEHALLQAQKGVESLYLEDSPLRNGERDDGDKQCALHWTDISNISASAESTSLPMQLGGIIPSYDQIDIPVSIESVHRDLLNSSIAIYLGCCDKTRDTGVVLIYCKHAAWTAHYSNISNLTTLLLYYEHLSRKKLTLIIDAREATRDIIHILLETISALEVEHQVVDIVHILVDRMSQALVLRSPFFRNPNLIHSSQIDLLTNIDVMYRVVDREFLPVELGGCLPPFHIHWVHFRQVFEPLLVQCFNAVHLLIRVAQHLSKPVLLAKTMEDINALISHHCEEVEHLLQLPSLTFFKTDGEKRLSTIHENYFHLSHNTDYSESMELLRQLLDHLVKYFHGLSQLANMRLCRLKRFQQIRNFEIHYRQVMLQLEFLIKEILVKYLATGALSEKLQELKTQQLEFSQRVQLTAQMEISKGHELLELGQKMIESQDDLWSAQTFHCLQNDLLERISDLNLQLDRAQEKMDTMLKCIQLLDKSYEWAKKVVKFVSEIIPHKNDIMLSDLEKVKLDLEAFLEEHPPISSEVFQHLCEQCKKLGSKHLVEQSVTIQCHCVEAAQLIKIRQEKLHKNIEQLRRQHRLHQQPFLGSLNNVNTKDDSFGFLRRRSYAGKPSTPIYGPLVEAFKWKDMDIQEYEEYLFNEGLITDNMSERIVTSLPKGLSDMTMRGSRESLRSSRESLHESQESLYVPGFSCENLVSFGAGCRDQKQSQKSKDKHHRMPWRMFKKAVSFLTEGNSQSTDLCAPTSCTLTKFSDGLEYNHRRDNEYPVCQSSSTDNWFHGSSSNFLMFGNRHAEITENQHLLPADESRRKRNLSHIMSEMIHTERDYVSALEFVIVNYLPELSRDDVVQPLRGKKNIVFGNIEKIYEFHSKLFLQELEQCRETPFCVGSKFLKHSGNFYLYALYNKNKPKSYALLKESGSAFFMQKQKELGEKLDLCSYLLKPVQRMGKYALLLEEIIKECPESIPEFGVLRDALDMVRFQLRHGNDLLAMDCIRHCDVSLQEQGQLLLQDPFIMMQGRHKSERHVFLFEDMILFTKPRRLGSGVDWLDYKTSFKTSDIGLTENVNDDRKFEIWFRKRTPDVTYILEAPTTEVKRLWIICLSRLLWKQAIRNRQRHRGDLSSMGHNWISGVDLKLGSNCTEECIINNSLTASKIRNSISVASFDRFKIGNKRPHSMLSVASSSSGSSHSSGYCGSLSPTFELPFEKDDDMKEDAETQTTLRHPLRWSHDNSESVNGT